MDTISAMIQEYRLILGALLILSATVVVIVVWWDRVSLWWLNVLYSLPVIGKISSMSKHNDIAPEDGWFPSEKTLCADYHRHYNKADKNVDGYLKCQAYLNKAQESGRNNLHLLGWILVAALVFVEALGFSYVLSGYTIPGASENLQKQGAIGIAFLISVLLVGLTHWTGHELHKNSLVNKARTWFLSDNRENKPPLQPNTSIDLDHNLDDDEPGYQQLVNRLDTNARVRPQFYITAVTVLMIVLVAVGATYVRGQVLETELIDQATGEQYAHGSSYDADPYSDPTEQLPAELLASQEEADLKADEAREDASRGAGLGTFIVLAFIFVFLQIFGIILGYKTGFAGRYSKNARKYIGKFTTKADFTNFYDRKKAHIIRTAEKKLLALQHKMVARGQSHGVDPKIIKQLLGSANRKFVNYLATVEDAEMASQKRGLKVDMSEPTVAAKLGTPTDSPVAREETEEEMEARIEAEILAQNAVQAREVETTEQREARIRAKIEAKLNGGDVAPETGIH